MEVPMFTQFGSMRMIVVLRVTLRIIHIALGIMVHFVEHALFSQNLTDDIEPAFFQYSLAFENFPTAFSHGFEAGPW